MANDEKTRQAPVPHALRLEERQKLAVSGVEEVVSFDESEVSVRTVKGLLSVRGSGLKVDKLEKTSGELTVSGQVTDMSYEEARPAGSLWGRLFK